MKNLKILIAVFVVQLINAQVDTDISVFNRILILNPNNELLVVKIENTDFWVTPGFYQSSEHTIKQGLDNVTNPYGIVTKAPELKGMFVLKRNINGETTTSLRNVFIARLINGEIETPKGIEEVKWLSPQKAIKLISLPHINRMVEQIMSYPNKVWGGTLMQYKEENKWKTKVLEEFYVLSE